MEESRKSIHLPSLPRGGTGVNQYSSISSLNKFKLTCLSLTPADINKLKVNLSGDSVIPASTDVQQQQATTNHHLTNSLPFYLENNQSHPKPKLLEDLEKFLEKELSILNLKKNEYNELSFLAHREVFEYLIDNFKTYKPLLSRIKNKYEMRMAQLKKQIYAMKPLKQIAATTSERYEHKIMDLREQDKKRLIEFELAHRQLSEKLLSLQKTEQDAKHFIGRLKNEIENLHAQYQEQFNQRRLLVTKMNDLRFYIEKLEETKSQKKEDPQEDPVAIRESISAARQHEKAASEKINEILADYSDLVPRPTFAKMEEKYQSFKESNEQIMTEFKTLKDQHSELLSVSSSLTEERNFYYVECEKLKQNEIAVDHWNKCVAYLNGGITNKEDVSSTTSCEILLAMLQETINQNSDYIDITGNVAVEPTLFTGLGMDPKVPIFLRFEGTIQGHRLLVRDCYLLLLDIWENRTKDIDTNPNPKPLADFLDDYLHEKFPNSDERVKWAYTFSAACNKLIHTSDKFKLFMDIIDGQADESIYHRRQKLFSDLYQSLLAGEKRRRGTETRTPIDKTPDDGFLTQEEFSQELNNFFCIKNPDATRCLLTAAVQQMQTKDNIKYKELFIQDNEEGFLTMLRDWQQKVQTDFINKLRQTGDSSPMSSTELKKTLQKTGHHLDDACVTKLVDWVFHCSTDNADATLPVNEIMDKLSRTFIPPVHRKIPKDALVKET